MDANTDPGFNPRPLGVIVCVLHHPPNDLLVLEQFSRGQCEGQDAVLVRHWYNLSTHAARHGGCHPVTIRTSQTNESESGGFEREGPLAPSFGRGSPWNQCPPKSTIATIAGKDLEMCY